MFRYTGWALVAEIASSFAFLALLALAAHLLLETGPGLTLCLWATSILTGIALLGALIAATTNGDSS